MRSPGEIRPLEPAVDAVRAVEPALRPRRESRAYCVTPDERHAWAAAHAAPVSSVRRAEVEVCRSVGEARSALETAYTVGVKELLYPGNAGDAADVEGKWVYVFRDQKLVVEAKAVKPGVWQGHTIDGGRRRPWRSAGGVRVDPGPKGRRHAYFFFLSPVQLTNQAIRTLEEGGALSTAAVECACEGFGKTVYAPDPLRWAADAHAQYYEPRVQTLQAWQYDEGLVAYAFVASVLKAWIDAGDRAGVRNELRRQPHDWLEARRRGAEEALREADEAAAYVAHCVDSPEYFAIERSGRERGGDDLELCAVALAAVTRDLLVTEPGKRLAQQLVKDPERIPAHFIFQDERSPLPDEWFERHRFGEKALVALFNDLVPAQIQLTMKRGQGIREAENQRDRIQRYLLNLRIQTTLKKPQAQILANLEKGEKISAGVPRGTRGWRRLQNEWARLERIEQVRHGFPTQGEVTAQRWSKRLDAFEPALSGFTWTIGSAVEIANVLTAYEALREASPDERGDRARAIVGAWADLLEHGGGLVDDLLRECVGKRLVKGAVKGATGVFGFVGSALDMIEYEGQLVDALGEYDYGKSVGRGIQVAGAATSAVGAGMVLAGAIYGSSLGPAGALVGAVGGALVATGFVLAAWLSHNANETFASRCFLGIHADREPKPVPWSITDLPTRRATHEARCLVDLLSQFQLSCFANIGDWWVHVEPGYVEDGWRLELWIHSRWRNDQPQRYRVTVDLADDVVRQLSGVPLKPTSAVRRDAQGRVERISINLEDAKPPEYVLRQFQATSVRARLVIDGKLGRQVPKARGMAAQIELPTSDKVASLDASRWKPAGEEP